MAALRLVQNQSRPAELQRDPEKVYLAALSPTGRRSMASKLRTVKRLLQIPSLAGADLCVLTLAAKAALIDAHAAPATVNTTLSALKGLAHAAWQLQLISADQLQKVRDVRAVRGSRLRRGRKHSSAELDTLLRACARDHSPAGARDAAVIALGYSAGLRRAEISALQLADYSPANQALKVRGKGDKERLAYLEDRGTCEALGDWLTARGLWPGPLINPVTRQGKVLARAMSGQAIYNSLRKRAETAGLEGFSPHNLRRTFATDLLEAGADIRIVSSLLGHANLETTKLYDERGDQQHRSAARLLTLPYDRERQLELPLR